MKRLAQTYFYRARFFALAFFIAVATCMLSMQPRMEERAAASEVQNVLLIQTDHELYYRPGYGDAIYRPVYDEFLTTATNFEKMVSVCPLCSPARQSIVSGLYPQQHGILHNETSLVPNDHENIFDIVNAAGYENYFIGKWHAGGGQGGSPQSAYGTTGLTIDGYGNPYKADAYRTYWYELAAQGLFNADQLVASLPSADRNTYKNQPWLRMYGNAQHNFIEGNPRLLNSWTPNLTGNQFGIMQTPKETHEAYFLAHETSKELKGIAARSNPKPFVMQLNLWGPHHPYHPTQEFVDLYTDENGKIGGNIPVYPSFYEDFKNKPLALAWDEAFYNGATNTPSYLPETNYFEWEEVWQTRMGLAYGSASLVDAAIGTVLDTLKETGLDKNTIVVWTADHGDALGSHGGHVDKQCYQTEEINRVPMAIRLPNVEGGRTCSEFVNTTDVPATLLDAVGLSFSNEEVFGRSMLPLARGQNVDWRDYTVSVTNGHFSVNKVRSIYVGNFKYNYNLGDIDELYNLETDPFEMNNLIYTPEYYGTVIMMKEKLLKWQIDYDDIIPYVNI